VKTERVSFALTPGHHEGVQRGVAHHLLAAVQEQGQRPLRRAHLLPQRLSLLPLRLRPLRQRDEMLPRPLSSVPGSMAVEPLPVQ
jgi:hypothetical protein